MRIINIELFAKIRNILNNEYSIFKIQKFFELKKNKSLS